MLQAVKNGKTGHSINDKEVFWRKLFKGSEDSLTSSIFERLFYLPENLLWKILRDSINQTDVFNPEDQQLSEFEFWPHWDAAETNNRYFVEPDVFISTQDFDLIIEAKRKGAGQYVEQWESEIKSYRKVYSTYKKVFLLALEGNWNHSVQIVEGVPILKCEWQSMLDSIDTLLFNKSYQIEDCQKRILLDIVSAFEVHGFIKCEWFEQMKLTHDALNIDAGINIISEWKID